MHTDDTIIDLVNATLYFRAQGFIHIHYKTHAFTLADNEEIFNTVRESSPWYNCPFLISNDDFSSHDKESNIFNSSPEVVQHCSAYAFVAKNTGQKIMVNFFIKMYRPDTPCKVFASEEAALEWLKPFMPASKIKREKIQ